MSFKASKKILKGHDLVSGDQASQIYEFGAFRIDRFERQLLCSGSPVPVTAKAFDTLLLLVQRTGHLVEKSEIMQAVWPDSFVEEGNLTVTIHMLRKALGDDGGEHKYIETVAKRGYRFVREVHKPGSPDLVLAIAESQAPAILGTTPPPRPWSFTNSVFRISILTLLTFLVVVYAMRGRKQSEGETKIHSLAVLPFRSLGSDHTQDYLAHGITDGIITRLGATGKVDVRPVNYLAEYGHSPVDPLSVGRHEKVDSILTGNFEVLPDKVRVTAQLVRVSDGNLLWTNTFTESPQRMFALEGEVENRVAESLTSSLGDETKIHAAKLENQNFKAYQLYLLGRYFWNKRTVDGLHRSIEYFQQATVEDPHYAVAFAGLADSYALLGSYGVEPSEQAYPNAKSAALRALQIDDSLSEAHASLGMISFYYEWNWQRAELEFRRSIKLNPNYPVAHEWFAENLAAVGRTEEALAQVQRAQELDPLSLIINTGIGRVFYLTRRYDQAVVAYRKVIDLDPQFARAHTRLGMTYAAERRYADAIREFQLAQQLSGPDPYLDGLLGYVYGLSGKTAKARKLLQELTAKHSRREFVPAFTMALICIGLGERDQALDWLSESYADRSCYMVFAKTEPLLDPVRSDPRFLELLNRLGLS
jgi:DNA-binding winged helix-turn-helix (wHTH) protein/TolB-like protein/Flp pilus assembly protein TadD